MELLMVLPMVEHLVLPMVEQKAGWMVEQKAVEMGTLLVVETAAK